MYMDKDYLIWGFPFYNNEFKMDEFSQAFEVLKEIRDLLKKQK